MISPQKFAKFADAGSHGARNGKKYGMKSNIVAISVE